MARTGFVSLVEVANTYLNATELTSIKEELLQQVNNEPNTKPDSLQDGFYLSYKDFLEGKKTIVPIQFEQKKKVRVLLTTTQSDSAIISNSWGFVEKGNLFVRQRQHFIPLQYTFGSWSGLGTDFLEIYKMPVATNPISLAVDLIDIAAKGPTTKVEPFKLFKLNSETGQLE